MSTNRLHQNFLGGYLGYGCTSSATVLVSNDFEQIQAVTAPEYQALVLNPTGSNAEIVWVTSHAANSASIVVARGQEGTAAASHAINEPWLHAPTAADFTSSSFSNYTSGTLPSGPAQGDVAFETDTYKVVLYNGASWQPLYGYSVQVSAAPLGVTAPNGQGMWSDGSVLYLYSAGSGGVTIRPNGPTSSSGAVTISTFGGLTTVRNTLDDGAGNASFAGMVVAPTAPSGTNSTQVATTAFAAALASNDQALYWMS